MENCSHRRFHVSIDAARAGPGIHMSCSTAAEDTGVSPKSVMTLFAATKVSVLRKSSSSTSVISTFLMPAFAQPSSDLRYPAPRDVFWWIDRVILPDDLV